MRTKPHPVWIPIGIILAVGWVMTGYATWHGGRWSQVWWGVFITVCLGIGYLGDRRRAPRL